MSTPSKDSPATPTESLDATISQSLPASLCVVVKCSRPIYRRAGFQFFRGRTTLDGVTPDLLAVLERDPCLTVESSTPSDHAAVPEGTVDSESVDSVDAELLYARIRDAIASLDTDNTEHFTQAGKPRVTALSAVLGVDITSAQIDAALSDTVGQA
ncbi:MULTISPECIES: HI1506-related protein [Hafnia]|uniref:HI1506-related protein n=1 Tax=Hafnia TaxID=568 RepID=UPI001C051146|nr:HI1506-related protein [Hafnia paralvei]MBU2673564.1 hypothetical protein [Hafnia paralvei]